MMAATGPLNLRGRWSAAILAADRSGSVDISRFLLIVLLAMAAGCGLGPLPAGVPEKVPSVSPQGLEPQVAAKIQRAREQVEGDKRSAQKWGHLGRCFDAHAFYDRAFDSYRAAFALDPSKYRWAYLAALASSKSDPLLSIALFEEADRLNPSSAAVSVNFGDTLFQAGDAARAALQYRQAIRIDKNCSHAYLGLARIDLTRGDLEGSRSNLERAAAMAPGHGEVHTLLGQVYTRLGDLEKAELAALRARAFPDPTGVRDPDYASVRSEEVGSRSYTTRGRRLAREGKFKEAEAAFRKVLSIRPGNARDYANLGGSLTGQGKINDAVPLLRKALEIDPDEAHAHHNLALAYSRQGRWAEAKVHAAQAVRIDPAYGEAHDALGTIHERLSDLPAAIASFRSALTANPGLTGARNNLARALASSGRTPEAIEEWQLALKIESGHLEARYNLGMAQMLAGSHLQAIDSFEAGLKKAPNSSLFLKALAWLLATAPREDSRNAVRALDLAQRVYRQYPRQPEAADVYAAALAENRRYDEAGRMARKAMQLAQQGRRAVLARQIGLRIGLYAKREPFRQSPAPSGKP